MNPSSQVPKDLTANLRWRRELRRTCASSAAARRRVRDWCAQDVLFWVNGLVWTYDPRRLDEGDCPNRPFVTWPFQDRALLAMREALGRRDIGIEKSRDMGASWLCLLLFLHSWQFERGRAFMLVSRNEKYVDSSNNPDALFWKLRYVLRYQEPWLTPRYDDVKLNLRNLENDNYLDGASTTGDVGRGGRRTAILLDEFAAFELADGYAANASTEQNTRCRVFNSTYQGTTGAFYEQMQRKDLVKIRMHWTEHPEKAAGLYHDSRGKPRSPWYDQTCKRLIVPGVIAQEVDIDAAGAASMFFPEELVGRLLEGCVPPYTRGRLIFDPLAGWKQPITFFEDPKGDLLLWLFLRDGRPERGAQYVIGADISAGTGATNSVFSVGERRTGEKVAELARADLSPDRFADLAVALAFFFNEACLIWEMNGPGGTFGKRVTVEHGYRHVYYRRNEQSLDKKLPATGIVPGWHASPVNRRDLFGSYIAALAQGQYVNRSRDAIAECRHYVYLPNGNIGNSRAQAVTDPSGARENHGDRPTADALCAKLICETVPAAEQRREPKTLEEFLNDPRPYTDYPVGSLAWRRKRAAQEQSGAKGWETSVQTMRSWDSPNGW